MRIKKIHLQNGYKRFHDLTIDLGDDPKRIIALVGANGCGKSSVFDGMLFLKNSYDQLGSFGNKDYRYHSMNNNPAYDHSNVEIEILKDGRGVKYQELRDEMQVLGKQNTMMSLRSPYRYNGNLNVKDSRAISNIKDNNYGASHSCDLDNKMEESYRRIYVKYKKYSDDMDVRPSEAKQKIIGDLNIAIEKCLDLKIVSLGTIEAGEGTLYFTKQDQPNKFEYNVLSSGEKEVVDILLDLYLRKDEYTDSIYIIDEPELHINTSIQKKLLIEINNMIPENCQIWIATHSIGFFRALQTDLKDQSQIIHFQPEANWGSQSVTLSPKIMGHLKWKEIFKTALDDLTELLCPKTIIYCEGKDKPSSVGQEKGLDAQVFNTIFSEKYPDTQFVSSGGNTELDQRSDIAIAILSKAISGLNVLILKDRDMISSGVTTEADRDLYLKTNPINHRVLERREIENYLFDKEVLKKYCSLNGTTLDELEYDKLVANIINDNVKDEINKIKNFCGLTMSINPDTLKIKISEVISADMEVYKELERCIFMA